MRPITTNVRHLLFLILAVVVLHVDSAPLSAKAPICDETCNSSSDCTQECYINMIEFENGNSITCLDYGVYDYSSFCCGDKRMAPTSTHTRSPELTCSTTPKPVYSPPQSMPITRMQLSLHQVADRRCCLGPTDQPPSQDGATRVTLLLFRLAIQSMAGTGNHGRRSF